MIVVTRGHSLERIPPPKPKNESEKIDPESRIRIKDQLDPADVIIC